jgi:tetratricopeptide (TPR) repeat protein
MTFRFLPLCGVFLSVALFSASAATAQSRVIDLDEELRPKEAPDRAKSYYHYALAKLHADRGDIPRALSEMRSALRYNESSSTLNVELASLLERSGNRREAIQRAEDAAKLDPQDPEPYWVLANIYFRSQGQDRAANRESMVKAVKALETMVQIAPKDERAYYALGDAYFELEQPEKAIQVLEQFQTLVPSTDVGYMQIAKHFDRAGNYEKALEYVLKAVQNRPQTPETMIFLANLYSKLNKNKEAIPIYRKLLELTGENLIKKQLASALVDSGEFAEAKKLLVEFTQAVPRDRDARVLLARALAGNRELPEAIEILKAVVHDNPDHLEAQFYLASAYEQSSNMAEAARIYESLLQKSKAATSQEHQANRSVFQQRLAAVYQEMGDSDKAIALYEELLRNDPDSAPRTAFFLINAYRVAGQFDKALALGKQQLEQNPKDGNIAQVYARALADAGKVKEGADLLLKMLQQDPSNVDLYVNLSQIYMQGKRYEDAERVLLRAEDRKLDNERLKVQLGTIYERQKEFDRAESVFKELLRENPKNAVALNYIGYMLADRGVRLQEAVKYVEEALSLDPNNGAYLDSLGWAFYKLNDLEKAEKYLLKAVELVKNDPVIHDHLGDLYYKAGDLDKAVDYWNRSLSARGEPEDAEKVRDKLQKAQDEVRSRRRQ